MIPATKAARQSLIVDLLRSSNVKSQAELVELLAQNGVNATASTVSRDLDELDAVRVRLADGALGYAVPAEGGDRTPRPAVDSAAGQLRLQRLLRELLVSAEFSANLVVLRTPPGAAQFLASAIDHVQMTEALGTIAGDDTVMIISRNPTGGEALAASLTDLARKVPSDD